MMDLPDGCLLAIAGGGGMTGTDRCMLSATCKTWRHVLLPLDRTIDARRCVRDHGFEACRGMGCPAAEWVTEVLAELPGDDEALVRAVDMGCPVGAGVAAAAVARGDIDMLVWAWRRGAPLTDRVARAAALAPAHVVRWLILQGCPVASAALSAMARADNTQALRQVSALCPVSAAEWVLAAEGARRAGAHSTLHHLVNMRLPHGARRARARPGTPHAVPLVQNAV